MERGVSRYMVEHEFVHPPWIEEERRQRGSNPPDQLTVAVGEAEERSCGRNAVHLQLLPLGSHVEELLSSLALSMLILERYFSLSLIRNLCITF